LFACEENARSPIPEAPVSLLLDLNYRDADLIPALASKSFTEPRLATDRLGFGGILVVAGLSSSGSTGNLFAYDLACPVEVDPKVKVVSDNVGKAVCPKCGAIFVTAYGNGMPETKSRHPLKSYAVRQISDKQYVVRN
jgi:nitrite reductase/ring-hydroxylating ferredoxin subunit